MKTVFGLMAQYDGLVVIPIETVCRDYFRHLTPAKFVEQARSGSIKLPIVKMGASQKAAKGVHVNDLADFLDKQRADAEKDLKAIAG